MHWALKQRVEKIGEENNVWRSQFILGSGIVICFLVSVASYPAYAEDAVEVRAAKVCAGVGQSGWNAQGPLKVDNLSVQGDVNGTLSVKRDGVDLGKIDKGTYQDYTKCLFTMTGLMSRPAESYPKEGRPGDQDQFDLDKLNSAIAAVFSRGQIGKRFNAGSVTGKRIEGKYIFD